MRRLLPLLLLVSLAAPAGDPPLPAVDHPPDLAMGQTQAPTGAAGQSWVGASGYKMVWVPAGSFDMGSPSSEADRGRDERQHRVTLTKGYWVGVTEVTQGLWSSVTGSNPSDFKACGSDCPVEQVSWCDSVSFANALSRKDGLRPVYDAVDGCVSSPGSVTWDRSADGYRLATEAEWEMAARGGKAGMYAGGELDAVAWYSHSVGLTTHKVCTKQPNALGLCDASGNVSEWTWDWYGDYPAGAVTDPAGPGSGSERVGRGGSIGNSAQYVRVAGRGKAGVDERGPLMGLRFVRSVAPALPLMKGEHAVQPKPQIAVAGSSATALSDLDKQAAEQECVAESLKVVEASAVQQEASAVATQQAAMRTTWLALKGREAAVLTRPTVKARAPMIAAVEKFLGDAKALKVSRPAGAVTVPVVLRPSAMVGKDVDCGTRSVALVGKTTTVPVAEVKEAEAMLVRLKTPPGAPGAAPAGAAGQSWVGASGYQMVWVPAGSFDMGSPDSEPGRFPNEQQHRVTLTKGYWVGVTEVTQGLWSSVTGSNPSDFKACGSDCPVEQVSWCDSVSFANALSREDGLRPAYDAVDGCASSPGSVTWDRSADGYRLATEAEWEMAARGGKAGMYAGGELDAVAWYDDNSGGTTHKVCTKLPNSLGLCDATGNVFEWTWDWDNSAYPPGAATDPGSGSDSWLFNRERAFRGGCWGKPEFVRVAARAGGPVGLRDNRVGLRLVRSRGVFEAAPGLPSVSGEGAVQPKPQIAVVGSSATAQSDLDKQAVEQECAAESLKVAEASAVQREASAVATQQAAMRTTWLALEGREAALLTQPTVETRAAMIAAVEKFVADAKALKVTRPAGAVSVPVVLHPSAVVGKDFDCGTRSVASVGKTTTVPVAEVKEAEAMLVRLKTPPGAPGAAPAGAAGQSWVGASGYQMVWVPAGTFDMGSPESEPGRSGNEQQHRVTLTKGYWVGVTEVTQGLWSSVTGSNPSFFKACGSDCPVEQVSWCDAVSFANALSRKDGLRPVYGGVDACASTTESVTWDRSADGYRLATEAEWEMAARGGNAGMYAGGEMDAVAWYDGNSGDTTHKVCTKQPNALGLCDASGNVWEWTWDWFEDDQSGAVTDPAGPGSGPYRVVRGGSWCNLPGFVRVAIRVHGDVDKRLGLRLVRSSLVP